MLRECSPGSRACRGRCLGLKAQGTAWHIRCGEGEHRLPPLATERPARLRRASPCRGTALWRPATQWGGSVSTLGRIAAGLRVAASADALRSSVGLRGHAFVGCSLVHGQESSRVRVPVSWHSKRSPAQSADDYSSGVRLRRAGRAPLQGGALRLCMPRRARIACGWGHRCGCPR